MGWSNAPCLESGCYTKVIQGTGYCKKHQREPFSTAYREPIKNWTNIKRSILARDRRVCYICGGPQADEVDHVIPLHQGGLTEAKNLRAVHGNIPPYCHKAKSKKELQQHKHEINTIKKKGVGIRYEG